MAPSTGAVNPEAALDHGDIRHVNLLDGAVVLGRFRWCELRLFELLGGWVQQVPEPAAKRLLADRSRRHARRAGIWRDRLPEVRDVDPEAVTAPPGPRFAALLEGLAAPVAGTPTPELLVADRVVLSLLRDAQRAHLARLSPVAEPSTIRSLRHVLAGTEADLTAGAELLASLPAGPEERRTAEQVGRELGDRFARAEDLLGRS